MENMEIIDPAIGKPAGFWIRLIASIIDGLIIGVPTGLLSLLDSKNILVQIIINLLSFLYSLLLPIFWNGYTVGKRAVGIRIVKINGKKLGLGTMLLRNIVSGIIYTITLGIAAIVSAFMVGLRKDKRAIHDIIAGTRVIHEKTLNRYED